ncbi:MAG: GTPase [Rhodospirillaceae bacterium]|nr:GTPase [Rhodospirillaceae bacterium]
MRLKYYYAPTYSEAMEAVRLELGDEAIIISTHEGADGEIRIAAALEEVEEAQPQREVPPAAAAGPAASAAASAAAAPAGNGAAGVPLGLGLWREDDELEDIVYQAFRDHGVPAVVGEALLDVVGGFTGADAAAALAAAFRQSYRFAPLSDPPWTHALMPVGPPGAGKTQTLSKLAAKALIEGRSVAVLTTDVERTGGVAHLRAFCSALNIDVLVAEDPKRLEDALAAVKGHDLVLVDSAGRNHNNPRDMRDLARLLLGGRVEPFLVFPAGTDAVEATDIAAAYNGIGVSRMVVTRLDMARRLGSVLAAAQGGRLAFAELSTSAWIRDGLDVANPRRLAKLFLANAKPSQQPSGSPS